MNKARIVRLRKTLAEKKIGAMFVSNPHNSFYLTGYRTVAPEDRDLFVLITKKRAYAFTHELNFGLMKQLLKGSGIQARLITHEKPLSAQLTDIIKKERIRTLGFEADDLTVAEFTGYKKKVAAKVSWKKTHRLIKSLRAVKDKSEIEYLKKAARAADKALEELVKTIRAGETEKDIAERLTSMIRARGYEPSFAPIVAIDKSAAVPHYDSRIGKRRVREGSLILIDYGVLHQGYASDTTRVIFYGKPKPELALIYKKLLAAQEATIRQAGAFKKAQDLDLYCREEMKKLGIDESYPHVTGHGVGIQVHDAPYVHFRSKESLEEGQVITVEPGIYKDGRYGMRIEDMVLLAKKGPQVFTRVRKKLWII